MKLYIDDIRDPWFPIDSNWKIVRTITEALQLLETENVEEVDLDHDMGFKLTGMHVLNWIEEKTYLDDSYIPPKICIHTSNPAVRRTMEEVADKLNSVRLERNGV